MPRYAVGPPVGASLARASAVLGHFVPCVAGNAVPGDRDRCFLGASHANADADESASAN